LSSNLDLAQKRVVTVLACKRPGAEDGTAMPVPKLPALTNAALDTKVRRFIENAPAARVLELATL
jgi:hypothetical protein